MAKLQTVAGSILHSFANYGSRWLTQWTSVMWMSTFTRAVTLTIRGRLGVANRQKGGSEDLYSDFFTFTATLTPFKTTRRLCVTRQSFVPFSTTFIA